MQSQKETGTVFKIILISLSDCNGGPSGSPLNPVKLTVYRNVAFSGKKVRKPHVHIARAIQHWSYQQSAFASPRNL